MKYTKMSRDLFEKAKDFVDYDPNTGLFTWKKVLNTRLKVGSVAGYINSSGDVRIIIDHKEYKAHRLAWYFVYGEVPNVIDHINGIRHDNRIVNLRNGNHRQNMSNQKCHREGKKVGIGLPVGITGVVVKVMRYCARVYHDGANHNLGVYETITEAVSVRENYIKKLGL